MIAGLLIIRLAVGLALILQGYAKLTRQGRSDTADYFESVGFRPGRVMAPVAGLTEFGAGALLVAGLATPLAVAGAVGILISAAVVNGANGYWNANGGAEYPIVLGFTAAALAFTGPGSASIDELLGWGTPTTATSVAAVVVGALAAAPILLRRRTQREVPSSGAPTITAGVH